MTIGFIFKKDWTGGSYVPPGSQIATHAMSFKKGQYVTGEVIANGTGPSADPSNFIVITVPEGQVRIPFGGKSYQGENAILESPVAPWLSQSPVDTTPTGTGTNSKTENIKNQIFEFLSVKRNAGILTAIIILIVIYLIYRVSRNTQKK